VRLSKTSGLWVLAAYWVVVGYLGAEVLAGLGALEESYFDALSAPGG